jgi:adenylate cyclase
LSKYIGTTLRLVVLYVDLVGSTLMTRSLPVNRLATIIQAFTQEMSFIVPKFGGQILKFVGDAVVAYFPFSSTNYYLAYNTAVDCSRAMIMVIKEAINPVIIITMMNYE